MDLLVVGDANADLVLRGGDIVPAFGQREQLVDHAELVLGGSGAILAAGAAKLGLEVAMVACVGDDPLGRAMRDELVAAGVDVRALRVVDAPTGVSVGLVHGDDRSMLTATGALAHLRAEDVPEALLEQARHVHVASPFLQDGLRPGLRELTARAAGTTSLDPGWDPRERWDVPVDAFDILLPNAEEALRLAGEDDVEAAARALAARGPLVVVKLGPEGALAARGDDVTRVRAPHVDAVDSTGAGDSFDAGFLAAWLRHAGSGGEDAGGEDAAGEDAGGEDAGGDALGGEELEAALALACACGALSTRRAGGTAAQPTLEEARAFA
jgi:ribokinase